MTLNKRKLKKLGESMCIGFSKEQVRIILDRFGVESWPNVWSEQDIAEQIRQIVYDHPRPAMPLPDFLDGRTSSYDDRDHVWDEMELLAYRLVDFLLCDRRKLRRLVMEAREKANDLSPLPYAIPYPLPADDVFDCTLDEHPAMVRYHQLFGNFLTKEDSY